MIPELAITKAFEGGWRPYYDRRHNDDYGSWEWQGIALDSDFWQALGKSLGWGTSCWHYTERGLYEVYRHPAVCGLSSARSQWQIQAQRFYDLILQGKDIAPFWQELLATTPNHE